MSSLQEKLAALRAKKLQEQKGQQQQQSTAVPSANVASDQKGEGEKAEKKVTTASSALSKSISPCSQPSVPPAVVALPEVSSLPPSLTAAGGQLAATQLTALPALASTSSTEVGTKTEQQQLKTEAQPAPLPSPTPVVVSGAKPVQPLKYRRDDQVRYKGSSYLAALTSFLGQHPQARPLTDKEVEEKRREANKRRRMEDEEDARQRRERYYDRDDRRDDRRHGRGRKWRRGGGGDRRGGEDSSRTPPPRGAKEGDRKRPRDDEEKARGEGGNQQQQHQQQGGAPPSATRPTSSAQPSPMLKPASSSGGVSSSTLVPPLQSLGRTTQDDHQHPTTRTPNLPSSTASSFLSSASQGVIDCTGIPSVSEGTVDRYERGRRISEGVYGVVFEGIDGKTGEKRALKLIRSDWLKKSEVGFPPYLLREFDLVMRLKHPNVVRGHELTYGHKDDGSKMVFLVMEFCEKDLKSLIYSKYLHLSSVRFWDRLAVDRMLSRVKCVMKQLLTGLLFLHEHNVLHRDLKCSNVLVDSKGILKLCDFGLGRLYQEREPLTPTVVTLLYRAPELHFGIRDYGSPIDVWSAGCIFFEAIRARPLFRATDDDSHFKCICDVIGEPAEDDFPGLRQLPRAVQLLQDLPIQMQRRKNIIRSDPEFFGGKYGALLSDCGFDFMMSLLKWNPKDRLTAAEALQHPYLTQEEPLPSDPEELMIPLLDSRYHPAPSPTSLPAPTTSATGGGETLLAVGAGGGTTAAPIVTEAEGDSPIKADKTPSRGDMRLGNLHDEEDAVGAGGAGVGAGAVEELLLQNATTFGGAEEEAKRALVRAIDSEDDEDQSSSSEDEGDEDGSSSESDDGDGDGSATDGESSDGGIGSVSRSRSVADGEKQ